MPKRAVLLALLGLVLSGAASTGGGVLAMVVADQLLVALLVTQTMLWAGLIATVALASRRYGTGNLVDDFQLRFERRDVLTGIGGSLAMRVAGVVAAALVLVVVGADEGVADQLEFVDEDQRALIVFSVAAVLGAPVVEELYFRGLLLQALRPLVGVRGAVVGQALLFGVVHALAGATLEQNALLAAALAGAGLVLGLIVNSQRRLGAAVWAHAWFNATSLLLAILAR